MSPINELKNGIDEAMMKLMDVKATTSEIQVVQCTLVGFCRWIVPLSMRTKANLIARSMRNGMSVSMLGLPLERRDSKEWRNHERI